MKNKKKALITGITGQDGSYLAELLLSKGYLVHGIIRRSSSFNTSRIDHLYKDSLINPKTDLILHYGDLLDSSGLSNILEKVKPDEIYNLGAQSHVAVSFELPEYTAQVDAIGSMKILEIIKNNPALKKTRYYQASSSELYGKVLEVPQNENTPFNPKSPYGISKLFAYWTTINYRESYGIFACNGILFNHESPRRGETFVTRKITKGLAAISAGKQKYINLGNLDALRDWGHARDYVEMQWLMLQQKKPKDYVISSGEQHSVRSFIIEAAKNIGLEIGFRGKGLNEKGFIMENNESHSKILKKGDVIIKINKKYIRPNEVDSLLGDSKMARKELNWKPKTSFKDLCKEMMLYDYEEVVKNIS